MMKLSALLDRYQGFLTILGFTYITLIASLGFWAQSELSVVLTTGGAYPSKYQPVAVVAKGVVFYVSQDQATKYLSSNNAFAGAIEFGLVMAIIMMIVKALFSHFEKKGNKGDGVHW